MSLRHYLQLVARHADAGRPEAARPALIQALNVKADGLADAIASAMKGLPHPWFVFDMSVPDTLQHLKAGNPVYARMSEFESRPARLEGRIRGIWLDAFESTWYSKRHDRHAAGRRAGGRGRVAGTAWSFRSPRAVGGLALPAA